MNINKEKLQKKLEELKQGFAGGSVQHVWKIEPGKHLIRVLPYPHFSSEHEGELAPELYFHYGVGKGGSILCPLKNKGGECPICEYVEQALTTSRTERLDKDVWKAVKNVEAVNQAFVPVLIRNVAEDDGSPMVRLWRINRSSYQKLIESLFDPDWEDFLDEKGGNDIKLVKEAASSLHQFGSITFQFSPKQTPIAESKEKINEVLQKIPDINKVYEMKSKEDIQKQLDGWVFGTSEEKKDIGGTIVDEDTNTESDVISDKLDSILNG